MPNYRYVLQYDCSTQHIRNNNHASSTVYDHIGRLLQQRGWARHQYSNWRIENFAVNDAANVAVNVATQMELRWGVGIFAHLEYERRSHFYVVR
jgi:virulence-associated protein VapD